MEKRERHYYHFPADSDEGRRLRSFHRQCQKAEQAQMDYARKVGAVSIYEDPKGFTGGVAAVVFADDAKVNPNVWRFEGRQEQTGERLYSPNVIVTTGTMAHQKDKPIPHDTARRLYDRRVQEDGTLRYMELTAARADAPKRDRTQAVTAERWRRRLPVVLTSAFYRIVHADLSALDGTQATARVAEQTPTFFLHRGQYYIGLAYAIRHDLFTEISAGEYNMAKNQLLSDARAAEELRKVEEEGKRE